MDRNSKQPVKPTTVTTNMNLSDRTCEINSCDKYLNGLPDLNTENDIHSEDSLTDSEQSE